MYKHGASIVSPECIQKFANKIESQSGIQFRREAITAGQT